MRWLAAPGVLALFVALSTGCAFTDINMELPQEVTGTRRAIGRDRPVMVVVPFSDARSATDSCGMQKNGYNMDTADAICDQSPTAWVAHRLVSELDLAGFRVAELTGSEDTADESAMTSAARIEGSLLKLFVEPVMGFWAGSLEADLHVRLRVTRPDGLEAEREFFAKGIMPGQMLSVTPAFEGAVRRAAQSMMGEMVLGIAQLLDEYPRPPGDSR